MSHIKAGSFEKPSEPLSEIRARSLRLTGPSTACATSRCWGRPPSLDVWGAGWMEWKGGVEMWSLNMS